MNGLFLLRLKIEGLYPEGVILKLKKAQIPLFNVEKRDKKTLSLCVERKFYKKVFTILQSSCYNIIGVEYFGVARALAWCKKKLGIFIGIAVFSLLCAFSDFFILRIEVVGTGSYYQREVIALLNENGVKIGGAYREEKSAEITAKILALENVSFCSVKKKGSVLKVEVQTSASSSLGARGALVAEAQGTVQSLIIVRGAARVAVGDEVQKGQELVGYAQSEDEIIMASAQILCRLERQVRADDEKSALHACILEVESVDDAEILTQSVTAQADGFWVEITYLVTQSLNM